MYMTPQNIAKEYREAKNKGAQVGILADQNCCSVREIINILIEQGVAVPEYMIKGKGISKPKKIDDKTVKISKQAEEVMKAEDKKKHYDPMNDEKYFFEREVYVTGRAEDTDKSEMQAPKMPEAPTEPETVKEQKNVPAFLFVAAKDRIKDLNEMIDRLRVQIDECKSEIIELDSWVKEAFVR